MPNIIKVLFFICIFFLTPFLYAADLYEKVKNPSWNIEKIDNKTILKCSKKITKDFIKNVKNIITITKDSFVKFEGVSKCSNKKLTIMFVTEEDLNNILYFTDIEVDKRTRGLYYKHNNYLYVAYQFSHLEQNETLAHELLHYFYDECEIRKMNIEKEHIRIGKILNILYR